jgi:hypothetical protein
MRRITPIAKYPPTSQSNRPAMMSNSPIATASS